MDSPAILIELAAILVMARVCAELAEHLGAPSVIGELAAGIVLGPSLLGFFTPHETIRVLAEIGIILLLFESGLETDFGRLARAGGRAAAVAVLGLVIPSVAGFVVAREVFQQNLLVSLFIAGTLTATSIGITVRVLGDLGRQASREGQVVLGAAVIDDVIGVILLAVVFQFATTGTVGLVQAGKVLVFIGTFFVLAPVAAKMMSTIIRRAHAARHIPGLIPTAIVALVLLFAWLAHSLGAPELLGGFAAGIALSRRFFLPFGVAMAADHVFSDRIHEQMKPIVQLFTPIFFVTVGLSLDLSAVDWTSPFIWLFSLSIGAVAIAGKVAAGFVVLGEVWQTRFAIGMAMVPRGEVGLIFAEVGRTSGILPNEIYAALIIVIAYTTLLAPFWIKLHYRVFGTRIEEADVLRLEAEELSREQ